MVRTSINEIGQENKKLDRKNLFQTDNSFGLEVSQN